MPKPQSRMEARDSNPWIVGCVLTRTNYYPISNSEANNSSQSDSLEQRGNGCGVSSREQVAASLNVKRHPHSPTPNPHPQPPPPSSISQTNNHPSKKPRRRRRPHRRPRPQPGTQPNRPEPSMTSRNPNVKGPQSCGMEAIPRGGENVLTSSRLRELFPHLTRGDSNEDMAARIRHLEEAKDRSYGITTGNGVQNNQVPRCG